MAHVCSRLGNNEAAFVVFCLCYSGLAQMDPNGNWRPKKEVQVIEKWKLVLGDGMLLSPFPKLMLLLGGSACLVKKQKMVK